MLADTKLIAEAWDAAGLYQVGSFIGESWMEWNGRFRDDVRSFMKADNDTVTRIPYRLFGSPVSTDVHSVSLNKVSTLRPVMMASL